MLRVCAVALSAGLLFATSFGAEAYYDDAESVMSASLGVPVSAEAAASNPTAGFVSLEEQGCDLAVDAEAAVIPQKDEAIAAALAPERFLDTHESETFALIATDLAATAETTASIQPSPVLDPESFNVETDTDSASTLLP